jgi:hypothetical protein
MTDAVSFRPDLPIQVTPELTLGGQLKTGQLGSLQNRPTGVAQDVILFIPLSLDRASLFWFSNSSAHI